MGLPMNEQMSRLEQDLKVVEQAIGLDVWAPRDVRRGMIGCVAGGAAGLFLALWSLRGQSELVGLILFLMALGTVLILKDRGYRRTFPSAGTRREVNFYNRFYLVGGSVTGVYFVWGQKMGMEVPFLFASSVVMAGLWYVLYGLSSMSRWISLAGASTLIACGFVLPMAASFSQMLIWVGLAACVGCWLEAALLFWCLHRVSHVTH
jgi:hypothetical protein